MFYDHPGSGDKAAMRWKLFRVGAIAGVAIAALLIVLLKPTAHRLTVKAYFTNGEGLRDGAQVRAAGVEIGSVRRVRVRPELKENPVEVVMVLNPPYEINIPNDSIASLATAGVLGGSYVEIEAAFASGPPIETDGVLKTRAITPMTTEQFFEHISKILERKDCNCGDQTENSTHIPTATGKPSRDKSAQ